MVEIKTELPKESSGRLLDALTDIIRPFSEKRGLRADQIRLQREEILIEIARRARTRLEIEGRVASPVSNKFLVPFLERASAEDPDSMLIDWWASLLASAGTDKESQRPIYIDFLAIITRREGVLLEDLWKSVAIAAVATERKHPNKMISDLVRSRVEAERGYALPAEQFGPFLRKALVELVPQFDSVGLFATRFEYPGEREGGALSREIGAVMR